MRTGSAAPVFLLRYHLGSLNITADGSTGAKLGELRYKPWGELRYAWSGTPSPLRYTGQRSEGLGLYDYKARFYDPAIGRWTQPDTLTPVGSQGVQAWERYAYVNNSPTRWVDPTGHKTEEGWTFDQTPPPPFKATATPKPAAELDDVFDPPSQPLCPVPPTPTPEIPTLSAPPSVDDPGVILGLSVTDRAGTANIGFELLLLPDGTLAIYEYSGSGASVGPIYAASFYGGLVFGAESPVDYSGRSTENSLIASLGSGATVGYFHNEDGTVGGIFLGPAIGYGLNLSSMDNDYRILWEWNPWE